MAAPLSLLTCKMRSLSTATEHVAYLPPTPISPRPPPPPLPPVMRLPRTLPPCPPHVRLVDPATLPLVRDDEELRDMPPAFLLDMMAALAPHLLAGCASLVPVLPRRASSFSSLFTTLPPVVACQQAPPSPSPDTDTDSASAPTGIAPTHLLAVSFSGTTDENVLVPLHALPWSLHSALLARLLAACPSPSTSTSTSPSTSTSAGAAAPLPGSIFAQPSSSSTSASASACAPPPSTYTTAAEQAHFARAALGAALFPSARVVPARFGGESAPAEGEGEGEEATRALPVVRAPIGLPSREAFDVLHDWVYEQDAERVWTRLVFSSSGASSCASSSSMDEEEEEDDPPRAPQETLSLTAHLWRTCVALEVADENLWSAMRAAWEGAVGEIEGRGWGGESVSEGESEGESEEEGMEE
ncbi:hypothetical protein JCM10207_005617 [Rhodosporidiobolus poonsookiae]